MYLASPYSHHDAVVREARFQSACMAAGRLIKAGVCVYSPIVHCHPIAVKEGLPEGWLFWSDFARTMLEAATELCVLTLDGWDRSLGVGDEIAIARELLLPISYMDPVTLCVSRDY